MIKLNTIDIMTEEIARDLASKKAHICFSWYNKEDSTVESMPGIVLKYQNRKITVDKKIKKTLK